MFRCFEIFHSSSVVAV